jgi:hypothetical protein
MLCRNMQYIYIYIYKKVDAADDEKERERERERGERGERERQTDRTVANIAKIKIPEWQIDGSNNISITKATKLPARRSSTEQGAVRC